MNALNRTVSLVVLFTVSMVANAEPDRDSLVSAWEQHIAGLPGTAEFEVLGDGLYRIHDTDLPYEGQLRLVGALLRPDEGAGTQTGFSQFGMVEFQLVDLPAERLGSQSYYYWIADRQTLHFSDEEQRWVNPAAYQDALQNLYEPSLGLGPLSFMLNYGIWIFLVALIAFVFVAAKRQMTKARFLMDDSADINQKARENLDRSADMQQEVLEIARESRELHRETNRLLGELLSKWQQ